MTDPKIIDLNDELHRRGGRNLGAASNPGQGSDIRLEDGERTRCEVWTRIMGYHRPVSVFNAGKRAEHRERQYFVECPAGIPDRIERAA